MRTAASRSKIKPVLLMGDDDPNRGAGAAGIEPLLDAEETGRLLGVPASWVYTAARCGQFPCVRMGRNVRFRPADIREWIATGGKGLGE